MNEAATAFVKTVSQIIGELSLGRPIKHSSRNARMQPGKYAREYFGRLNKAISAARTLGALPSETARFSVEEMDEMGSRVRAFGALGMSNQIRELILTALKERRVPPEVLSGIGNRADTIVHSE